MSILTAIYNFLVAHWFGVSYVGVAAITALVAPGVKDGGFYGWFYRFATGLLPLAKHDYRIPGVPMPVSQPVSQPLSVQPEKAPETKPLESPSPQPHQ